MSDQLIGDKVLDILKDLPAFSALMEGDVGAINYFKAVITRPVDARAVVGKVSVNRKNQFFSCRRKPKIGCFTGGFSTC